MRTLSSRLHLWSACLGNLMEHFDSALFGVLSPFLAPLFFPNQEPLTQLLLTYAMVPLGMLARPLGALIFGHIGDEKGREKALFLSLTGMGIVSLGMGFCPIYSEAGFLAPVLFCLGRILQNLLSAGETMGGAVYLLEQTEEKHHDFLSSLYSATTVIGILLPSACIAYLSYQGSVETGWRWLYFFGGSVSLLGCLFRRPGPVQQPAPSSPLSTYWQPILLIALVTGFSYVNYTMALVLPNGLIPLVTSFSKEEMAGLNTFLLAFDLLILPLFGWLSSKVSRYTLMMGSALMITLGAIPLLMLLEGANFFSIVCIRILFVIGGVAFCAPLHAWAQTLIPPSSRYLVISLGYALGAQILGGPASFLALFAYQTTGSTGSAGFYWTALALMNVLTLWAIRKTDNAREKLSRA